MGPRPRLHEGRLFARTTEGCTPILTFPLEGGRERGEGEGRFANCPYGKRGTEGMTREGGGVRGGERWVPAPVFTRAGYSRGQREETRCVIKYRRD